VKLKVYFAPLALVGVVLASGCGGISASKSVSPASFFMPGFGQNQAPNPHGLSVTSVSSTPASLQSE